MGKGAGNVAGWVDLACYSAIHALGTDEPLAGTERSSFRAKTGDLFDIGASHETLACELSAKAD
jgi:hypothetical protein